MGYGYPNVDFKSGGDGTATAEGYQSNWDSANLVNKGHDVGVALPDVQTDEDITKQGQNVQAAGFGGHGGADNVYQNLNV